MTLTAEPRTSNAAASASAELPGFRHHAAPKNADPRIVAWVDQMAALTTPDAVVWVDGSRTEQDGLLHRMVESGTVVQLNPEHRPYSFLARSNPDDVARVESRTFICSEKKSDAGPSNNWAKPSQM